MGLKIPDNCRLKVKGEVKSWEQGKVTGFIDAFEHEAWNNSTETRIILLFDILKPAFAKQKSKIFFFLDLTLLA